MEERTMEQPAARLTRGQADALLEAEDLLLGTMESMRRVFEAPCPGIDEAQTCRVHYALLETLHRRLFGDDGVFDLETLHFGPPPTSPHAPE